MSELKHYAERDICSPELVQLYADHVCAMTREGLHGKGDIAAELAWRDAEIARLKNTRPGDGIEAAPQPDAELVEALTLLKSCQQACLFEEDDGQIGVSEDAVISSYLFDSICKFLAKHKARP